METFKGFMDMFKGTQKVLLAACIAAGFSAAASADYSTYDDAQALMDEMVAEHKFDRAELQILFKSADKKQSILDAIARARAYVIKAIESAPGFGHGHGPLDHGHTMRPFD